MTPSPPPVSPSAYRAIGMASFLLVLTGASLMPWSVSIPAAGARHALDAAALARAEQDLARVAGAAHPIGSPEAARVRDYIVDELTRAGAPPELQEVPQVLRRGADSYVAAQLRNVVTRIPGRASSRPLLLVGHYDSPPYSPGAGDNGAAVAALLETVRQVKAGAPPQHDLIVLFTDGEEVGLLGARAFMARHPWARDAAIVLNFDARGNDGPSIMFETGDGDGWLVREFAKAAPYQFATSLSQAVYDVMPNDTDFTVFRRAGLSGLNFAFIGGASAYHTGSDTPARLARESLIEHVALATALARHLGNVDARTGGDESLVYFDVIGQTIVMYPTAIALPFAIVLGLAFVALVIHGRRRGVLTVRGLLLGAILLPVAAALAAVTIRVVLRIASLGPLAASGGAGRTIAILSVAGLVMWAVYAWPSRRTSGANLAVGALASWTLLTIAIAIRLPGASYLPAWPLAGALLAGFASIPGNDVDGTNGRREGWTRRRRALLFAGALPVLLLLPRMIHALFVAASPGDVALAPVTVLCVGLLLTQFQQIGFRRRWTAPAVLAAIGALAIAAAVGRTAFETGRVRSNYVQYVDRAGQDGSADAGALWVTMPAGSDEWTSQYVGRDAPPIDPTRFPAGLTPVRAGSIGASAPSGLLPAPVISLVSESIADGRRHLRFTAASARGAAELALSIQADDAIESATVEGLALEPAPRNRPVQAADASAPGATVRPAASTADDRHRLVVRFHAPPTQGITFEIVLRGTGRVLCSIADRSYDLPAMPGRTLHGRSRDAVPAGDASVVLASFVL